MRTLRRFREEDDIDYKNGAEAVVAKQTFFVEQTVQEHVDDVSERAGEWGWRDGGFQEQKTIQGQKESITSRLNWQTTNNITRSPTNQDNDQRLITSTED